jgi:hypothetical protein
MGTGNPQAYFHQIGRTDTITAIFQGCTTQTNPIVCVYSNDTTNNATREVLHLETRNSTSSTGGAAGFGPAQTWFAESSVDGTYRQLGQIDFIWATATDGSRKARGTFWVWDTSAREVIRIQASGSAGMLAFFGATAVVKQTGISTQETGYVAGNLDTEAEIISALNTTNTAINALRDALVNYGLITDE